ncbi:hypothetical protein PIB30_093417, partial [Stylosanthes scabra]|nr:hypothetical protein [Stylosanthes scabra]
TPRRKTGLRPFSPSQHLSGVEHISKEDHRAKGHHTPPPISQGLRGNITRSTRRKRGLRGLMPPSQLSRVRRDLSIISSIIISFIFALRNIT